MRPDLASQRARKPDQDLHDAVLAGELGHGRRTLRATALEDTERGRQHTKLVAQRDADAPLAGIKRQNPSDCLRHFGGCTDTSTR